jgi:agmatine deiminase
MVDLPGSNYFVPAEWAPHAATWLSWPHRRATWPRHFEPIPGVWAGLVETLSQFEPVHVLASGATMAEARGMVGHLPRVSLHDVPTNDAWIRDHGPIFLARRGDVPPALLDWDYNAWGGKYPPFSNDNDVPRRVAELLGFERFQPGIILEGGSVDFNGQGSVLTSEQCLLNPNRNPDLSRAEIQRYLADFCGAGSTIWLGEGIVGDDTDGHIDELARFVAPRTVVAAWERDPADENYHALDDNLRRLSLARDEQGRELEIIPLPMPQPVRTDGQRLPASYCNFYIANGVVIVPQFDDPADVEVVEIFRRLFPDRQIRGLRAMELVWGLGAFHCITQQQPAS